MLTALLLALTSTPTTPIVPFNAAFGPLTITCPPEAKVTCGGSTDPSETGYATATSSCSPAPLVTYSDAPYPLSNCPADRFESIVARTWTATDTCGNTTSCEQLVVTIRQVWALDILPGSCPNTIDLANGPTSLTFAIAGSALQNVNDIVPGSLQLWLEDCSLGPVAPASVAIADVATPFFGVDVCECSALGANGIADLRLTFDRATVASSLQLGSLPSGSTLRLVVTGTTVTGCTFLAVDCVRVENTSSGTEGCSHGYWMNHLGSWGPTGYAPTQDFDTVFGVNAFTPNRTLLQALQAGGGGINNLGRQGVAALLSASHPGVDFPLTQAQVLTLVHDAVINGTVASTATYLDSLVTLGCPLN